MVVRPNEVVRVNLSLVCLLTGSVGIGIGWAAGNYAFNELVTLIPSALILFYFARLRTLKHIRLELLWCSIAAASVPIVSLLTYLGYLQATNYVHGDSALRFATGVRFSELGAYAAIVCGSYGGLLFIKNKKATSGVIYILLSSFLFIIGFAGALSTGQRSSGIVAILCGAFALAAVCMTRQKGRALFLVFVISTSLLTIKLFGAIGNDISSSFSHRIKNIDEGAGGGSSYVRLEMYRTVRDDILAGPALYGMGLVEFENRNLTIPHFVLGQAYYLGGLLFVIAIVLTGIAVLIHVTKLAWKAGQNRQVYVGLSIILIGLFTHFSIHPGINIRPLAMIAGIGISCLYFRKPTSDNGAAIFRFRRRITMKDNETSSIGTQFRVDKQRI